MKYLLAGSVALAMYVDPFPYAVHGFKAILLKDGGFTAIPFDLLFLAGFGMARAGGRDSLVQAQRSKSRRARV